MVNHEYKGIYTLGLDENLGRVSVEGRRPPSGIGASLFKFGKNLKYATDDAVFEWDDTSGVFRPDSLLTRGLKERPDRPYGILIPDERAGRLWGFGNGTIHYVEAGKIDERPKFNKIHVPESFRINMGVLGFECLANLGGGQYLIGRSNGFVVLDLQHSADFVPKPEITGVRREMAGEKPALLPLEGMPEMAHGHATLRIEYHVPAYAKFMEVRYQHRLEGYQDSWSNWTTESAAVFSNLPHGEYRFEVRARVGDSVSEAPAVFSFEVLPPWYLTRWALAVYTLLLVTLLYGVHLAYRAYYRAQQRKIVERNRAKAKREALRAEKKIAEARNEKLQQEIEGKNRELAISTMSLIKKNEFLRTLKSELKSAGDGPKVKKVLKTIDRNIGSEADWKFFEAAFNNADKDFLKHIREQHPDLTPSDLRLCAYLRLNLSSKEIAPLLNISVRSVEVKRYRLRKKLQLSRDVSLSDYILGFQP